MSDYIGYYIDIYNPNGGYFEYQGKITKGNVDKLFGSKEGTLFVNETKKDIYLTLKKEPQFKSHCDYLYYKATGKIRHSIFKEINGIRCVVGYEEGEIAYA